MQTPYFSLPTLPWDRFSEDERNFRIIIAITLAVFVLTTVVINSVTLPEKQREQQEAVPARIAKLITEIRLPPPKVEEPKPEPKPELKPEPKAEEKPKETPKPVPPLKKEVPKPATAKPVEKKAPQVTVKNEVQQQAERKEKAKQEAQAAVQVFDALADLRTQPDVVSSFESTQQNIGAASLTADGPPAATQRNLIGKMAAGGSGGVAVAKASSGGGGAGVVGGTGRLGKASSTAVTSAIAKVADPVKQNAAKSGSTGKARRTSEQIQLVFDRYKGQIYALYRRALREDPSLEGTLLLRLEIQPNGSVTQCSVVSSELSNADLERKIVVKVKQLNFGTGNVEVWSGNFPIKFFPS